MSASLVTGGAGFIGSHVARHLLEEGHTVVVCDDLSGGFEDNLPEGATFVAGDVSDEGFVDDLFGKFRFDYVFHLAAYAAEGLSHFIRRYNYINNVVGSVNLINASVRSGVKHFVFTSSIAVYGEGQLPMDESMTPQPEDPYGIAKLAVEMDLAAAQTMFGLDYTIFRPHNVYGEHQNIGDRYRNVVGIFMNQIMSGEPLTIFGDGEQTRAFSHIDDVAPIIAASVEVPAARNEVFNVGADIPYSVVHLAHVTAGAFGVEPDILHLPPRVEVQHAYSSHEKVQQAFGHRDPVPLEIGISRMAEWARSVGARKTEPFEKVEVWKNFPEAWAGDVRADGSS